MSHHGVPSEILSDRGKAFLSSLMKEVVKLLGTHQCNTTAYHPQTDGLVERFSRTLTAMLVKTVDKRGCDWDKHIPYMFSLFIGPLNSYQPRNHHSTYFMGGILDCQPT